jgi:succinate dehydrogenase / fumarate reductase flavoprotein subunit
MDRYVGIYRHPRELERAIEELGEIRERARKVRVEGARAFNPGWHLARDLGHMIDVSEGVTRSALLRKESRGAHSRLDFPNLDPAFGTVNHCVTLEGGRVEVRPTPLPQMPAELKALFEPAKEAVK